MTQQLTLNEWRGSNYFFLNGRCVTGGEGIKPIIFTSIIFPIPIILFLVERFNWVTILIPAILIIPSFVLLFMAGLSDPGVLKRNRGVYSCHDNTIKSVHLGHLVKTKICITCQVIKPYRSSHCSKCDNCVMNFDHHCPWIGNCVALRNYLYFYFFVFILNIESWYIGAFSITHLAFMIIDSKKKYGKDNDQYVSIGLCKCIISLFIILFILIEMIFITALLIYHTVLICKNETSKEELKKLLRSPIGNIYDRGIWKNIKIIFCRLMPNLGIIRKTALNSKEPKKQSKKLGINPDLENESLSIFSRNDKGLCYTFFDNPNEMKNFFFSTANLKNRICNTSYQISKEENESKIGSTLDKQGKLSQKNYELKQLPTEMSIPKENSCEVFGPDSI